MALNIMQVVGYQNSGKTTLASLLIRSFHSQGMNVVSLKHHGHEIQRLDTSLKDTDKHQLSGSILTGLATDHRLELTLTNEYRMSLDYILKIYNQLNDFDLLVIEGYKKAHYPKVVMLKGYHERHLLSELTCLICVIAWNDVEQLSQLTTVPVYHINDQDHYLNVLIERIGELKNE